MQCFSLVSYNLWLYCLFGAYLLSCFSLCSSYNCSHHPTYNLAGVRLHNRLPVIHNCFVPAQVLLSQPIFNYTITLYLMIVTECVNRHQCDYMWDDETGGTQALSVVLDLSQSIDTCKSPLDITFIKWLSSGSHTWFTVIRCREIIYMSCVRERILNQTESCSKK